MNPSRISLAFCYRQIIDECPNIPKNISVRIKTYNVPNIRLAASNNA